MAELKAIIAHIRAPIYSLKQPQAFQTMVSLPLPQPSTLVGALAYCLAVQQGLGASEAVSRAVNHIAAARSRFLTEVVVPSYVVLRRFRVLDKGMRAEVKEQPKPYDQLLHAIKSRNHAGVRQMVEDLSDALYREYVFVRKLECVWVMRDVNWDANLLWSITRLGDTESLCQVENVSESTVVLHRAKVIRTSFPAPFSSEAIVRGSYILVEMETEHFLPDRRSGRTRFVVPCEERIQQGAKGFRYRSYRPTEVEIEYGKPVIVLKVGQVGTVVWKV